MLAGKKTYIGAAVVIVNELLRLAGFEFASSDIEHAVESAITLIGAAIVVFGRFKANKE